MKKLLLLLCVSLIYAAEVNLTKDESEFIKTHTVKCITTGSWAPFNTVENGKLVGISVDIWNIIKKRLHIKSECLITSWPNVIDAIKHQRADLTIGTSKLPSREKFAIFTKPYAEFPIAIATKNNVGFIGSMNFLKNKKIAVGKNYTADLLLKKHYPNFQIIEVENVKQALKLVSEGKAYAAIDIMPVLVYNINKYSFANLKIAGKTPWKFELRFMLSKNNKLLASAINKVIDTITPQQKKQIYKKWVHVTYQEGYSLKEILSVIFIASIIIGLLCVYIFSLKKEIKKRKLLEKELQKLSIIDSLTGIFNRYKIDMALKQQISYAKRNKTPLSIIFFDIDHFKKINDNHGHKIGDEILMELTELIKNNVREYDIFGRWGGEEFIIILPNTDLIQALKVAEKLKNKIESYPFKYIHHLTCSFGVTELTEDDTSDSIVIRADNYMYEAKKRGRNRIVSDLNYHF
ncbi:diguanylate cyclase [Nautilia sp. PV-1]|uniref:transporter substrate-binding domain-containing diguanylate cyclase n=1 Tax=Nautilia sp. PV-1 TaxID=2579250 RepID=UPI000FD9CC7D|nr:diguanylate cyclase [Nautilia sp. PV-1]AZV46993.1 diguanylate cyclase [Nautilia sp. PV-1]